MNWLLARSIPIFAAGVGAAVSSRVAATSLPWWAFWGLYQINFFAPAPPLPYCTGACTTFNSPNGNVALTVRRNSSDTASLCVLP